MRNIPESERMYGEFEEPGYVFTLGDKIAFAFLVVIFILGIHSGVEIIINLFI